MKYLFFKIDIQIEIKNLFVNSEEIKAESMNRIGFQPDSKIDIGLKPNKFSNHSTGLKPRANKKLPSIKPENLPVGKAGILAMFKPELNIRSLFV